MKIIILLIALLLLAGCGGDGEYLDASYWEIDDKTQSLLDSTAKIPDSVYVLPSHVPPNIITQICDTIEVIK